MRFEKGHTPWNRGLKYGEHEEPAAKRFRRDEKYYLKELEINAKRAKKKGWYIDQERKEQMDRKLAEYKKATGTGRPRRLWSEEEMAYLRHNVKLPHLEICKHLNRSWASVGHKIQRLGLSDYNRWN